MDRDIRVKYEDEGTEYILWGETMEVYQLLPVTEDTRDRVIESIITDMIRKNDAVGEQVKNAIIDKANEILNKQNKQGD